MVPAALRAGRLIVTDAAFRFPIERGHVLMYARAIGDDVTASAIESGADVTIPPGFLVCMAQFDPRSHLRPRSGQAWAGSGATESGVDRSQRSPWLAAEQDYEFFGPIRTGDVLTVETRLGRTWQKEGRKGTLRFEEFVTEFLSPDGALMARGRAVRVAPSAGIAPAARQ